MNAVPKAEQTYPGRENFVSRLYQMLNTPEFSDIVSWNETEQGPSFVILDTAKFQEHVLVNEFNHANFSSFVRQLNKYDFHKVKFRDAHSRVWEFMHANFRPENRDKPHLVKRKQQSTGRRMRRGDSIIKEQAEVAMKAAELAASNAESIMQEQVTDLESRVTRLEQNNVQILSALKLQQNLVERLLNATNLPDYIDDEYYMGGQEQGRSSSNMQKVKAQNEFSGIFNHQRSSSARGNSSDVSQNYSPQQQSTAMGSKTDMFPVQSPSSALGIENPHVMCAVDDETTRDVLVKFLLNFGCRVESVDNGIDAVQKVETNIGYDYILIDCILKSLDGISAVELIRQINSRVPILLLSDEASAEEHEMFLSRGVSGVLYRPFSQTDLYNALYEYRPQTII